ncbi:hypothetical protein GGR58DRAFT_268382 [Xylaria digitata]|nr:hypothetical protein GGR58DRAFT_268382 [Xylaria digitata]
MNLMRVHYIYTSVTIIFRPNASTFTLRIEANQLEPFHGSFSSIPRLFINNIIPSHAKVFQVAAEGSIQDLENLFASGQANIRDHGENGWSLLHHSLRNPPMCRFLIRSGLDVDEICCDVRRNSCLTPLHISYYHFGNIETTRSLLMGGADPVIEPGANISVAYDAIFGPEPESSTLFWDIIDLSSHFLFFNPTDSDRATLWLSAFQPRQYMMPHLGCLPSPAKKIEFLLNKGARPDKRIQWDQTV